MGGCCRILSLGYSTGLNEMSRKGRQPHLSPLPLVSYFLTTGTQPQLQPQLLCDLGVACAFCAGFFLSEAVMDITSFLYKLLARYL